MSVGNKIRKRMKMTPRKFQIQGVRFIEKYKGRVLVGDDMGLGKTYQAIAWFVAIHPELRPVIILCPAFLKYTWQDELKKHVGLKSQVLEGFKAFGIEYRDDKNKLKKKWFPSEAKLNKYVLKHDKYKFDDGYEVREHPKIKKDILICNYEISEDWKDVLLKKDAQLLVADECHYCKNTSANRTRVTWRLSEQIPHMIAMSGTPMINRPVELFPILRMLRPMKYNSLWKFAFKYCNPKRNRWSGGWDFKGASNLDKLHKELKTVMIRRTKAQVLKELPLKTRIIIPVGLSNRKSYTKAEDDFIEWLKERKSTKEVEKAKRALSLVRLNALKQLAAEGKINSIISWIKDWLESSNEKLVVFGIHRSILSKLKKKFPKALFIDGSTSMKKRRASVKKFQQDKKHRLIVGNIQAMGLGITLTASSTVLFIELGWTPGEHNQAEDRVLRIGQESDKVNIYYMVGKKTIEERILNIIEKKREVVNQIMDGRKPDTSSVMMNLLRIMSAGGKKHGKKKT